jgi:hypothetical protein
MAIRSRYSVSSLYHYITPLVALFESSVNVLVMVLAVFMPYIRFVMETDDFLTAIM